MEEHTELRAQFERDPWPVVGFLTTEHTSLTSSRAASVAEGSARVSTYLTTVSASLVALGFVAAGTNGFDQAFFGFGAAVLGVCTLVGLLTFRRCVQISVDDLHMLSRIERVRRAYIMLLPGLQASLDAPVLVAEDTGLALSTSAASAETSTGHGGAPSPKQVLLTMSGLVGVVNSVVLAAGAACLVRTAMGPVALSWVVGGVVLLASFVCYLAGQIHLMKGRWDRRAFPQHQSARS